MTYFLVFQHNVAPFCCIVDQLTLVLYNIGCKIIVKKQEKILRLLIVEDEKQICDMVAKSLYAAGYEVDTCYDRSEERRVGKECRSRWSPYH